jgi:hypothetical protein
MTIELSKENIPILVENIKNVFHSATDDQINAGHNWYSDANRIAYALANTYHSNIENVIGVIAAVSPLNSWGNNINLAGRIVAGHTIGMPVTNGYLQNGLIKANSILDDPYFHNYPEIYLKSQKIAAFYDSILNNGMGTLVCVDRHAYSIAIDEKLTNSTRLTNLQYRIIANAYNIASNDLNDIPVQILQAITWVVWRQRYWSVGAFDGGEKDTH